MLAVSIWRGKGCSGDVLYYPGGVAQASVEGGDECGSGCEVGDGTGEAVLEESCRVDGRDYVFC